MTVNSHHKILNVTGAPYYPREWVDESALFPELSAFFAKADNSFREVGAHGLLPSQPPVLYPPSAQNESTLDDSAMDIDLNGDVPASSHSVRYCTFCGTTQANRWGLGPQQNTLCNAHYVAFSRHRIKNEAEAELTFAPQIHTLDQANAKQQEAQRKAAEKIAFMEKPYCQVCASLFAYRWTTPKDMGTMCGPCYKQFRNESEVNPEKAKIDFARKYFSYEAAQAEGKNSGAELTVQQDESKRRFCEHCGKTKETRWYRGLSNEGWLCNTHGPKLTNLKKNDPESITDVLKINFFSYEEALQQKTPLRKKRIAKLETEKT